MLRVDLGGLVVECVLDWFGWSCLVVFFVCCFFLGGGRVGLWFGFGLDLAPNSHARPFSVDAGGPESRTLGKSVAFSGPVPGGLFHFVGS